MKQWIVWPMLVAALVMTGCKKEETMGEKLDKAVLEATVNNGPAVDGVSRLRAMTVDNLGLSVHHSKLREIRTLVRAGHAV